MTCEEFRARLSPYADGEVGVDETLAADAHAARCGRCEALVARERQFRQLLRRQPRESARPELRARILAECRREVRRARLRPWLWAPPLAAAAALAVAALLPATRPAPPVVGQLVAVHLAYAELERPAEFASTDRAEVEEWFHQRARLRVIVPDYSSAGIRLVGGRIAEVRERRAAYLLYEKGHTLLSVFMLPVPAGDLRLTGTRRSSGGFEYYTEERNGLRTVSWTEGESLFGLVSMLDYDALFECADRLRAERASQRPL